MFEVLKNKYVANLKLNYIVYIGFKYLMLATCAVPIPCLHIIFMGYHKYKKKVEHKYMLCVYVCM